MQIIAHRGSHRVWPENTIAAFREAIAEGADAVELDVRTCKSGEVVVCHDPHLGRVGGRAAWVARLGWRRIRSISLGDHGDPDVSVPLLDDVVDLVVGAGLEVHVEVKSDVPDLREVAEGVRTTLQRRHPRERAALIVSSFHPRLLLSMPSGIRTALAFWRRVPVALGLALAVGADGLHPSHTLVEAGWLAHARRGGRFVNAWTTHQPEAVRRLLGLGVAGLITDDVPRVRRILQIARETPISGA